MNQYRCENNCTFFDETTKRYCTCHKIERQIDGEDIYLIARIGCASHSSYQNEREEIFPNSRDLLLISHDEWKRREERKHIYEEQPWTHGWISGFLTSRKFVKEQIKELRSKMGGK